MADNAKFEKVKPWGNKKNYNRNLDEDGLQDPAVHFSFVISCNEDPDTVVERSLHAWRRGGGNKLELSELPCFEVETAIVVFNMLNDGNQSTLLMESNRIMAEAMELKEEDPLEEGLAVDCQSPPNISVRVLVPKIPGLNTSQFDGWDWRDANQRKAFHLQCAKSNVTRVQELFKQAKEKDLVVQISGSNVRVSNAIPTKSKRK